MKCYSRHISAHWSYQWTTLPQSFKIKSPYTCDNLSRLNRRIRASTASANQPVIVQLQAPPFQSVKPVMVFEISKPLKIIGWSSWHQPSLACLIRFLSGCSNKSVHPLLQLSVTYAISPCSLIPFQRLLKQTQALPLLTKPTLDPDNASSYRPISNLSYLTKINERVVIWRFNTHISNSHLLTIQQSAYSSSMQIGLNRSDIAKMKGRDCSVSVRSESIMPFTIVRNLRVYRDEELTMKQLVAKVASSCFYHNRRLYQIHRRVGIEVTTQFIPAFIT